MRWWLGPGLFKWALISKAFLLDHLALEKHCNAQPTALCRFSFCPPTAQITDSAVMHLLLLSLSRGASGFQSCHASSWLNCILSSFGSMGKSTYYICRAWRGKECTLSLKYPGEPKRFSGKCKRCAEYRCRDHCKCARDKVLEGRERGRGKTSASSSSSVAAAEPSTQESPTSPINFTPMGRPCSMSVQTYFSGQDESWLQAAVGDLFGAKEVLMCMYAFDDPDLHSALLAGVRPRYGMRLAIVVDADYRTHFENGRLKVLQSHGARLYACKGLRNRGSMHMKLIIIDSKIAWSGSSNATKASRNNFEIMHRFVGPPVKDCWAAGKFCSFPAIFLSTCCLVMVKL